MRIWCQLPISMPRSLYRSYYDLLQRDYDMIKRPGTETVIVDVPTGLQDPSLASYLGLRQANEREILKNMLQAEIKGFDAIVGACSLDAAVKAAANLMDIPVIGAGETSIHLAQMMGRHFATIVSDIPSIDQEEAKIDSLDARKFAITHHPVRCLKMDEERFFNCLMEGDYDQVIRAFYEVAQNCIEDGADVLISGCGLFSPMLTTKNIRQVEGVPIIDPMQTALKFAEMMVDFKAAGMPVISRKGIYLKASREEIEKGCHQLGLS